MIGTPAKSVEVFYSYAHKDEEMRDKLEKRLDSLRRQGLISQWHDRQIPAGAEWASTIDTHLDTASVILLLISPDFMASTYCYDIEMTRALERHQAKEACVIPIILRPTEWHNAPFAKLQALPSQGKPITTWNNQDEAFFDITRGIRRTIEVWTTPTSSFQTASEQIWNIPHERNPFFTGQEVILSSLREMLEKNIIAALTQPQAISGLGGIGKTQIAVEYAYRYRDEYRAVLWARADSRESLVQDFVVIATLLHLPEKDEQDQNIIVEAVIRWLDTHDQWLLILDNVDDVTLIRNVLPSEANGHILLTTRSQLLGTIAQNVKVEHMGLEDGTLFLLKRAGLLALNATLDQAVVAPDRAAAEKLVQALDGLPLALDQAGAYINETGCGVSGYLERYRAQRARLLKRRGTMVTDYPETVATTWSLSFEKVYEISPVATELLNFCAFLHPDAIPEELITEGAPYLSPKLQTLASDLIAFDEVMEALRAYSLIQRNPDTKTLSMHRLVQAVLIGNLNDEQQRQWAERAVRSVNQLFPSIEFASWPQCDRYLLHAQVCKALIDTWNFTFLEAARLLSAAGSYLYYRGRYAEAEPLFKRALAIREQQLGIDHPDTAASLNNLALLYRAQGKYAEAEPLFKRALAIREQQLGIDHPDTAASLNNLALLYQAQGKYAEAEPLFKRALAIYEQQLGIDHPDTATSLNNLAELYRDQGKYAEAEPLYKRALAICEQQLGIDHPDTATNLNNLALLYQAQGKYAEAEPLFKRSLAICEQQLGQDHPDTATNLNNLAGLYRAQGKYAEAEPLFKRSLAICEQQLGIDHPDTATSLDNLAGLYRAQGKYAEAEPLFKRSLAICEQQLGIDHPDTATSLNNLAGLYRAQGKYAEAEPLYKRALAICEQQLGIDHPGTATNLGNLAGLYRDQGKYAEAEPLYKRALAIREQQLGIDHPSTATNLGNLAGLYRDQGKYAEAEPLYKRALAIREQQLGIDHPDTATSLNNLAGLYRAQGKYAEAEPLYKRALAICEQQLGQDHPDTATMRNNYAMLRQKMQKRSFWHLFRKKPNA